MLYIMMKRSQIYLPAEQWRRLGFLSHQLHESISELIRRAIDKVYRRGRQPDFARALNEIAGLWKDRRNLPSSQAYVRDLRRSSRFERFSRKPDA